MKHYKRTLACGAALLAAIVMIACGGKQTMASKSAAAYDEAKKKGIPIASGEHGGHSNNAEAEQTAGTSTTAGEHAAMPGMDHGAMAGADHSKMSGMDHSAMAGMDHAKMPGMQHGAPGSGARGMAGMNHSTMAGTDHSKMPGMQHGSAAAGSHGMAGMNHSVMPEMQHGSMPGIQHGGTMAAMPQMRHGTEAATLVIAPPASNAAIARTEPAATLRADEFDAPAPAAIVEAAKGASGMSHSMEATPKSPAPAQHNPPQPQPPSEHHHDDGGEAL
jgi:uncharacterized protein involved in copper resistance